MQPDAQDGFGPEVAYREVIVDGTAARLGVRLSWCRDQGYGRTDPNPAWGQATRT